MRIATQHNQPRVRESLPPAGPRIAHVPTAAAVALLGGISVWSYWPCLLELAGTWQRNDDYSAGQLVPLVAAFLIWHERKVLRECTWKPDWWAGLALLLAAQMLRLVGLFFIRPSIERVALVLTVPSLVLIVAGRQVFRRVAWILLFLFLMLPLPSFAGAMVARPLRAVATTGSVILLEAVGMEVNQQGNVIMLGEHTPIAVAEACSGLRMLTAFIIVAAFVSYMVKRPHWQKGVLLVSSIPAAVICNIVRIFATAVLMLLVSSEAGDRFFHDFAGLVMMPVAVLLLFGELWLMNKLVVPESGSPQEHSGVYVRSARRRAERASQ